MATILSEGFCALRDKGGTVPCYWGFGAPRTRGGHKPWGRTRGGSWGPLWDMTPETGGWRWFQGTEWESLKHEINPVEACLWGQLGMEVPERILKEQLRTPALCSKGAWPTWADALNHPHTHTQYSSVQKAQSKAHPMVFIGLLVDLVVQGLSQSWFYLDKFRNVTFCPPPNL